SHSALQAPSQDDVHSAVIEALHWPSQAAVKLIGVHLALHPPPNSAWHSPNASDWRFPQASAPAEAFVPSEKTARPAAMARPNVREDDEASSETPDSSS